MKYQLVLSMLTAAAIAKCTPDSGKQSSGTGTESNAAVQSPYGRCGGEGWTGATACANGAVCTAWNPYYHQCVEGQTTFASSVAASSVAPVATSSDKASSQAAPKPSSSAGSSATPSLSKAASSSSAPAVVGTSSKPASAPSSKAASSSAAATPSSQAQPAPASSAASSAASAGASSVSTSAGSGDSGVYKASFTQYGSSDTWGSGTCNTKTAACGFYSNPGYNAAVSENFFGVGPGAGAGPGCGTCWALTPSTDSSGKELQGAKSIVVKVNNLCPAQGNPLCSQSGKTGTNQYGANVNFDLCIDDGANTALFGSSNVGLAVGTATQVDCSTWSGTDIKRRMII